MQYTLFSLEPSMLQHHSIELYGKGKHHQGRMQRKAEYNTLLHAT